MGATVNIPHRKALLASAIVLGLLAAGFLATKIGTDAIHRDRAQLRADTPGRATSAIVDAERRARAARFRNASFIRDLPADVTEVAGAVEHGRSLDPPNTVTKCDTRRLTVIALSECTTSSGGTNVVLDVAGALTVSAPKPETPQDSVGEPPPPAENAPVDRAPAPLADPVREEAAVLLNAGQPLLRTTGGLAP